MNETKATNPDPKEAASLGKKISFLALPFRVLAGVALAMSEGSHKYGRHNYRAHGVRMSTYYDAVLHHLIAWWEGEDIDPDSGLNHIDKAIAGLMVLRDVMIGGGITDDRPPRDLTWFKEACELQQRVAPQWQKAHGDPVQPYTQRDTVRDMPAVQPPVTGNARWAIAHMNSGRIVRHRGGRRYLKMGCGEYQSFPANSEPARTHEIFVDRFGSDEFILDDARWAIDRMNEGHIVRNTYTDVRYRKSGGGYSHEGCFEPRDEEEFLVSFRVTKFELVI